MKIVFNFKPLKLTVISAYAPHAGIAQLTKGKFYANLTNTIEESTKDGMLIIAGDFNAKLYDRTEGEHEVIGDTIYLKSRDAFLNMSEDTKDNRPRFGEPCIVNELTPLNT